MKKIISKVLIILTLLFTSCNTINFSSNSDTYNRHLKFLTNDYTYALVGSWRILPREAPDKVTQEWIDKDSWVTDSLMTSWKSLGIKNENQFVSYSINLNFDMPKSNLYIYPGEVFSAQRIFIKNKLGEYIKVYSNIDDKGFNNFEAGQIGPPIVRLPPLPKNSTLVVQIANGPSIKGKFDYPIIVGSLLGLTKIHNSKLFFGSIFLGIFLLISITQFLFGANSKKEKEYIYIGLIFFTMAIRVLDSFSLIYYLGVNLSSTWLWRIGWYTLYFIIIFWLLMFKEMFDYIPKLLSKIIILTSIIFIVSGLFSDKILGFTGDITRGYLAPLTIIISLYTVTINYIKNKKIDKHMGIWTVVVGGTGAIDIVSQTIGVNTNLLNWGLVTLGIYLLASHNKRFFRALDLSLSTNRELEKMVDARTIELKRANRKLELECITDALTKLPNRKALYRRFDYEISNVDRNSIKLCLAIIDADFFKSINDRYGHDIGDEVLIALSKIIRDNIRTIDFISRFGGEEFVLLMPTTSISGAIKSIENVRSLVAQSPLVEKDLSIFVTISVGITEVTSGETLSTVFKRADNALYKAKESGRNQVVFI